MTYRFICECGHSKEYQRPLKKGPPKRVKCPKCGGKMWQDYGASVGFVLKGRDWPGKELSEERSGDRVFGELEEKTREEEIQRGRAQKNANEVLKQRRRGRRHFSRWSKENKHKVKDYKENMRKKGIKGRAKWTE